MEKRKVTVCFSETNTSFLETCVSGCLPCAPLWNLASGGSKISKKTRSLASAWESCLRRVKDLETNTFSGLRLGILPPAGHRSQNKHVPGEKHS